MYKGESETAHCATALFSFPILWFYYNLHAKILQSALKSQSFLKVDLAVLAPAYQRAGDQTASRSSYSLDALAHSNSAVMLLSLSLFPYAMITSLLLVLTQKSVEQD